MELKMFDSSVKQKDFGIIGPACLHTKEGQKFYLYRWKSGRGKHQEWMLLIDARALPGQLLEITSSTEKKKTRRWRIVVVEEGQLVLTSGRRHGGVSSKKS